ncbi:unnamed protein product, partial [Laminaria digitata]
LHLLIDDFLLITIINVEKNKESVLGSFETQVDSLTNEMIIKLLA